MNTVQMYTGKGSYCQTPERTAQKFLNPSFRPDQRQPYQLPAEPLTSDPIDPDEVWLPFPNYVGRYEVSNLGRVRTADGQIMPPVTHPYGFEAVWLSKQNSIKLRAMAILYAVAKAFLPNPLGYLYVIHLDGNSKNNLSSNLVWHHSLTASTSSSSLTSSTPPSHA